MNRLIVIGYMGVRSCYLNLTREQALERYRTENPDDLAVDIKEVEFVDEFNAYDVWEK